MNEIYPRSGCSSIVLVALFEFVVTYSQNFIAKERQGTPLAKTKAAMMNPASLLGQDRKRCVRSPEIDAY